MPSKLPHVPDSAQEVIDLAVSAIDKPAGLAIGTLEAVGRTIMRALDEVGKYCYLTLQGIVWCFRPPFRIHLAFKQMEFVGVRSLSIIAISGTFTGMVFALQSGAAFAMFGAE